MSNLSFCYKNNPKRDVGRTLVSEFMFRLNMRNWRETFSDYFCEKITEETDVFSSSELVHFIDRYKETDLVTNYWSLLHCFEGFSKEGFEVKTNDRRNKCGTCLPPCIRFVTFVYNYIQTCEILESNLLLENLGEIYHDYYIRVDEAMAILESK